MPLAQRVHIIIPNGWAAFRKIGVRCSLLLGEALKSRSVRRYLQMNERQQPRRSRLSARDLLQHTLCEKDSSASNGNSTDSFKGDMCMARRRGGDAGCMFAGPPPVVHLQSFLKMGIHSRCHRAWGTWGPRAVRVTSHPNIWERDLLCQSCLALDKGSIHKGTRKLAHKVELVVRMRHGSCEAVADLRE